MRDPWSGTELNIRKAIQSSNTYPESRIPYLVSRILYLHPASFPLHPNQRQLLLPDQLVQFNEVITDDPFEVIEMNIGLSG